MSDRMPATVRAGERVFVPYKAIGAGGGPLLGKGGEPYASVLPAAALSPRSAAAAASAARARGEELLQACVDCRAADALALVAQGDLELDVADRNGRTPLMWAASREPMEEVVRALVEAGAQLDCTDDTGDTALILACSLRRAAPALLLIERGADVRVVGEHGRTALDHANETRKAIPDVAAAIRARMAGSGPAAAATIGRSQSPPRTSRR